MSTTRSRFVIAAAASIGLAGWMLPQEPEPGAPGTTAGAAAAKTPRFVLLSDGRLVEGVVTEEDNQLVVTQPIGAMRYPKRRVERIFPSIRAVYEYKLEQLPERDDDERLKLARWCLSQKMEPEARQQLDAILDHTPKHFQAKAMVVSLDQASERRAMHTQDAAVQRTSGVPARSLPDDRPAALDAAVISGARRGMGLSDMPVVFDLPPAQAVRRAEEFARYVHPVVQFYCARCHNDQYDGGFQLVPFKAKADRTPNGLKANLDACLRLVDRENPVRSELLASSLRPHGRGPNKKPVFQGSNDPAYKILSSWVSKLQAPRGGEVAARAQRAPAAEGGESFASARGRVQAEQGDQPPEAVRFTTGPVETKVIPPARFEPGKGMVPDSATDPDEFPLPFATGGKKPAPKPAAAGAATATAKAAPAAASPAGAVPTDPGVLPAAAPADAKPVAATAEDAEAPAPAAEPKDAAKKPRKPVKLDPSLLQKALQLKNQGR